MLDVAVRFKEKDATVRYLPAKVGLAQILKQYDDTPFDVTPDGPIVSIAHTKQLTLRGWTTRKSPAKPSLQTNKTDPSAKKTAAGNNSELPRPIRLIVDLVPATDVRIASQPMLSLSDPPAAGLELAGDFQKVEPAKTPLDDDKGPSDGKVQTIRWAARLTESVTLKPGEIIVPVGFDVTTVGDGETQEPATGRLDIVLRTIAAKPPTGAAASTGVAIIGGALELRLGHLCDQTGCVEHFHKSLAGVAGVAAVRPHPSLEHPTATLFLRAHQAVDVWGLRERLRDRGVEITGMAPRNPPSYRLRVELPRWQADEESRDVVQCMNCRDRTVEIVQKLAWAKNVKVAGGGISFEPAKAEVDLVELLDAITLGGTAPRAVWLVPDGVATPKTAPPQLAGPRAVAKQSGSQIHPLIELEFAHFSDVGTDVLSLLGQQKWASLTQFESDSTAVARLAIADRKYANLTPLLHQLRSTGRIPGQIRLREFGDVRIQVEFSHICGDVEYSKPPKPKKNTKKNKENDTKKNKENDSEKNKENDSEKSSEKDSEKNTKKNKEKDAAKPKPKPKKPFVPKALRPASTSNGRRAIEAAVASVGWVKDSVFHDYHTKPSFKGPRKLMISLQARGDDVIRLEQLIGALRSAGFPPKSVIVSRRFAGIPFAKPLPGDLQLTDRQGKQLSLASLKKSDRPLALVFVSLKCPRKKKYSADPKYYQFLKASIDKYQDRVDFWAVSANKDDKFADVEKFWEKTAVATVPLLHDADGSVRAAFNSQVTPAPHLFVFDAEGLHRYAGDAHDNWEGPKEPKVRFLDDALELVLAGKYQSNGAVYYNKSVCNCSHPTCKCPKCGCGSTCRCGVKRCGVGF